MGTSCPEQLTGHCYCGAITFSASEKPEDVAYCHCDSCRRSTGGAVAAFAGFKENAVTFTPHRGQEVTVKPGAKRTFCADCGSSLTGSYDYLPDQIYIAIGVIDQADALTPNIHCHDAERLSWLHIDDELERMPESARAKLNDH